MAYTLHNGAFAKGYVVYVSSLDRYDSLRPSSEDVQQFLGHQKRLRKTTQKWVLSFSGALHTAACSQETRFSD